MDGRRCLPLDPAFAVCTDGGVSDPFRTGESVKEATAVRSATAEWDRMELHEFSHPPLTS